MTPEQLYAAIANILKISIEDAELICNHLMVLTLGRSTTDSASWRLTPPILRNDLQTPEKMPTKLLNSLNMNSSSVQTAVNSFSARIDEVVGNHYPGQTDEDAFTQIGSNLIQSIYDMKNNGTATGGSFMSSASINIMEVPLDMEMEIFEESGMFIPKRIGRHKVLCVGGGQGGGNSGVQNSSSVYPNIRGGGGGCGNLRVMNINIDSLDPISVVVGKGGAGAPAMTFSSTNPTNARTVGDDGGDSSFGTYIVGKGATEQVSDWGSGSLGSTWHSSTPGGPGCGAGGYTLDGVMGGHGQLIMTTNPQNGMFTKNGGTMRSKTGFGYGAGGNAAPGSTASNQTGTVKGYDGRDGVVIVFW